MFKDTLEYTIKTYKKYKENPNFTSEQEQRIIDNTINECKQLLNDYGEPPALVYIERHKDQFDTMKDIIDFSGLSDKYQTIDTAIPICYWNLPNSRYMVMVYPNIKGFIGGVLKGVTAEAQSSISLHYPEWDKI